MDIVVGADVNIDSIDKCLMDYYATITEHATKHKYIILETDYFTFTVGDVVCNIKCDYECRNYIMSELFMPKPDSYYERMINTSFNNDLALKNGIFYNTRRPYMLFSNEPFKTYLTERNTITETYAEVDIQHMTNIVRQKRCHQTFFIVNLGNGEYMSCNTTSFHVNRYPQHAHHDVLDNLYMYPDLAIEMPEKEIPTTTSTLSMDMNGNPIRDDHYYYLNILTENDNDNNDILMVVDDKIIGSNGDDGLIVRCKMMNDQMYFIYMNKYYICADDDQNIVLNDEMPSPDQCLQFVDNDNRFKIVHKDKFMDIDWITSSYGDILFRYNDGLDMCLEPF